MSSAFSSSDQAVLERHADVQEEGNELVTLEQIWGVQRKVCLGWIKQNNYKKVCLQFPDHYLPHSNAICSSLKEGLDAGNDAKIFILADTSYGSCCVDEIAAQHVEADSIIHFGNACRSKISRLPVLYIFPQLEFSLAVLCQKLAASPIPTYQDKSVCIYLDIGYHHILDHNESGACEQNGLVTQLQQVLNCKHLLLEVYPPVEDAKNETQSADDAVALFIGADNARFFQLSLSTMAQRWFIYNPLSSQLEEKNPLTANYIRRRYYYIEKCKDAQTLGLIVATLTANGYLEVVSRLQEIAKARGVKTQIISVGRINPAKLANFMEIDCFVLIGCPFNNMYNSKEFYKPIVSVFEAEMALNPAWHMRYPETYVTDFKQLLPEGRSFLAFEHDASAEQDVSLVSGRMRNNVVDSFAPEPADTSALSEQQRSLVEQPRMAVMTNDTGLSFEDRTWKGLNPALGCNEPAKLQKGLSGIPIKYSHD